MTPEIFGSRRFAEWLSSIGSSLAFTTYQAGKLFLVGRQEDGRLSLFERSFDRPMGLATDDDGFWMATRHSLVRFRNLLSPFDRHQQYDALFSPLRTHVTGDVDAHDLALDESGRPVFVATLFNCLATIDDRHSFSPVWRPPFVDRLVPEDRCHLNGLAVENGLPAFVTAVSTSNVSEGWRTGRRDGGVVISVATGDIVASGLSMPHSPRLHGGRLWLLNAGTGEVGFVDNGGRFEAIAFCPGFLRGMCIIGDHAVVGLSRLRESVTLRGLDIEARLDRDGAKAACGLRVINLVSGNVEHALHIEGLVEELYDVAVLPGVARPAVLGFKTDEICTHIRPAPYN